MTQHFRCEPEGRWDLWPAVGSTPLFLLRPQNRAIGALWLRVDMLRLPIDDPSNRLIRLSNQSLQMSLGRNLWKFGALVSQKLHTPLSIVLGSLEMISRDSARFSPGEIARLADLALRSGQRMQGKIQEMISLLDGSDLTELDDGFGLVHLESLVEVLSQLLQLGNVKVETSDDWQGVRVKLSPASFELMLREIMDNLRRIRGSSLIVKAERSSAERARVSVCAAGVDLSASMLELRWVPFYSSQIDRDSLAELADEKLHDNDRDRGMGLSMVGSLIWGIGGKFEIREWNEGGLEVKIELPCGFASDDATQSSLDY